MLPPPHRGTYARPCSCEFEALITDRMLQGGVRVFSFKTSRNSMLVAKLRVWWFVTKIDRNYLRYVRMGLDKAVDSLDIPRCSVKLGAEKTFVSCLNSEKRCCHGQPSPKEVKWYGATGNGATCPWQQNDFKLKRGRQTYVAPHSTFCATLLI